jgi:hypothetical protein
MDFDFLSNNLHIAYPFRDDVMVTRPSGSTSVVPLVAAIRAYTADRRNADLYLDAFDIRSDDSWATLTAASLTLRWSDDDVQFVISDGVNSVANVVQYGEWLVASWRSTEEPDFAFHAVIPLAAVEGAAPETVRFWKDTANITVLAGVVKQGPNKVRRVYLKRGVELVQLAGPGEEIIIRPGFNMKMAAGETETEDVGRKLTKVAIDAVPDAGTGKYLLCNGSKFLRTLNGTGADALGNTNLAPEECYWLELPVRDAPSPVPIPEHNITESVEVRPHRVGLRNTCVACCSCENYIKSYDNLRKIWNDAKTVSERYQGAREAYHAVLTLYEEMIPEESSFAIIQRGKNVLVAVRVLNDTGEDVVDDILIRLVFELPDGSSFEYNTSIITGLGGARFIDPDDDTGEPNITIEDDLQPEQAFFWSSSWRINGIEAEDEVTVTMIISGSLESTETKTITWTESE